MKKFLIGFVILLVVTGVVVFAIQWNMKRVTNETYNRSVTYAPYDVIIVPGLPYNTAQQNILLKVQLSTNYIVNL